MNGEKDLKWHHGGSGAPDGDEWVWEDGCNPSIDNPGGEDTRIFHASAKVAEQVCDEHNSYWAVCADRDRLQAASEQHDAERAKWGETKKTHASERDAWVRARTELEAELEDYRRAWTILDEPGQLQRMPSTATEAAHAFVALLKRTRAELEAVNRDVDASTQAGADYAVAQAVAPWRAKVDALHARVAMLTEAFKRLADAVIEDEELHETDENGDDLPGCSDGGDCDCPLPNLIDSTLATTDSGAWLAEHDARVRADHEPTVRLAVAVEISQHIQSGDGPRAPADKIGRDLAERDARVRTEAVEHFKKSNDEKDLQNAFERSGRGHRVIADIQADDGRYATRVERLMGALREVASASERARTGIHGEPKGETWSAFAERLQSIARAALAPGDGAAEHVCDYRCGGDSGHHAWPSPAPGDGGGT